MKQLVYMIAFGKDCLDQFRVSLNSIRKFSRVDVALITDENPTDIDCMIFHKDRPRPPINGDKDINKALYHSYFTYRTNVHEIINVSIYDQVWYMDTDIILKGDLFGKYTDKDSLILCKEPGTQITNIHFSGALTHYEKSLNPYQKGINAGIYSIGSSVNSFMPFYQREVRDMIRRSDRAWLTEQHVLNMIYIRHAKKFNIKTFIDGDIGFPAKQAPGKLADHFACYPFDKKLNLMKCEV